MDPSAEPTAISLYDDGEWAYNAILQEGTSWLWNPRSQGVTALDNVSHAKNDHGAIPSLPRAPKGFRKEDRSLENTMKDIYRLIIHNRAMHLKQMLRQDDYTFDHPATCQPSHEQPVLPKSSQMNLEQVPLLFSEPIISNRDRRFEPEASVDYSFDHENRESIGYAALNSSRSEIRVLQLMPGLPWSNLVGRLVRTSLADIPSRSNVVKVRNTTDNDQTYEALSYVWGPTTRNERIDLSDVGQKAITDNLGLALRRLRHLDKVRTIWIDAICINQDDTIERGLQVQMMGQIYSSASRVLVWLGDCNEPREIMVQKYLFQNDVGAAIYHGHNQLIERNPLDEEDDWCIRDLLALVKNAESRWWERAWVVQEFALSHYAPIVCFGCHEISWNKLRLYMDSIHSATGVAVGWESLLKFYRLGEFCSNLRSIMELREKNIFHFQQAMYLTLKTKATDPRDRVFALLSLVKDFEAAAIVPDYTKGCAEVFIDATASLMKVHGNLDIFSIVIHRDREQRTAGLPSWAVDFTFGDIPFKSGAELYIPPSHPSKTSWNPSAVQSDSWSVNLLENRLIMRAISLGTIKQLFHLPKRSSRFPDQNFQDEALQIQRLFHSLGDENSYHNVLVKLSSGHPAVVDKSAHECVELSMERDWSSLIDVGSCGKYCGGFPRVNTTEDILTVGFLTWSKAMGQPQKATYQACRCKSRGNISNWTSYCDFFGDSSVIFMTSFGFVGIAPSSLEVGDVVLLPSASSAPIIVRGTAQSCTFEGLAFVNGIMEGELFQKGIDLASTSEKWILI